MTRRLDRHTLSSAACLCAALLLFAIGAAVYSQRAYAQSGPPLAGQVKNGTANAPAASVAGLQVTLFQMGGTGPLTRTVQTDAQGRFEFPNVAPDANAPVFARVDYQSLHYFSDVITPASATTSTITLTVYETEPVPAGFRIDRAHFVLDVGAKAVSGIEFLQVTNPGDRAFLVPLPRPRGISDLQFNDPRDQFRAVRGIDGSISFPITPDTSEILLGVQAPLNPPGHTFVVDTPIPIGQLNVLVSQASAADISSKELQPGPVFSPSANSQNGSTAPASYWQLNGSNVTANSSVAVAVTLPGEAGVNPQVRYAVVLGGGALAGLLLLGYPFWRRWREPAIAVDQRIARLQAIADLDDAHAAGRVDELSYQDQRAALRAQLVDDTDTPA